ncbi:ubiquinol-cytochrome-c reductase complex subunit-domain-containing protein [Lineolata rhizophorae]|uniref:Ubiquinol-cytochrome-c reductase complex subunit-domain-containing protein n=1 Tax=Lineolata rhizophorae TaxID=578093 RepID=A0A6A6PG63_9PEZI|nr:ubiquinol-cytochrome-c reductase complex subunit-domain-containing protein [Lineolata rhizophorae]
MPWCKQWASVDLFSNAQASPRHLSVYPPHLTADFRQLYLPDKPPLPASYGLFSLYIQQNYLFMAMPRAILRLRPTTSMFSNARPLMMRRSYTAYQSPHGPKYKIQRNIDGITLGSARAYGQIAAGMGGVVAFFALFFFAEVPRVAKDIMQKVPVIGPMFEKEVPPEDNPF